MITEKETILRIVRSMPASAKHVNDVFHSDSEIVHIGDRQYLFSIDTFSDEDHFRTDRPSLLGRNLCACTASDILACGGNLTFFAHSLTVPPDWDLDYIGKLAEGIADVITMCQGFFAGGDLNSSPQWSFTGTAFGEADRIVTREGARRGDLLYLSGPVGAGNFEAASTLSARNPALSALFDDNRVEFPLRIAEAQLMAKYASACIDTSDGLLNGLMMLSEINGLGFAVSSVPYFLPGVTLTQLLGLPAEILMAGECGEYELLFTVPPEREAEMLRAAEGLKSKLYKIGRMTERGHASIVSANRPVEVGDFALSARAYRDHGEYVAALTRYLMGKLARTG